MTKRKGEKRRAEDNKWDGKIKIKIKCATDEVGDRSL